MTWGQIRFQLLQLAPGTSLDIVDEYLNSRYEQVLEAGDWLGIHARTTLQTVAAYISDLDTVTLTVGSPNVVGEGTTFDATTIGRQFHRVGDSAVYTVMTVADALNLTLDRAYEGCGNDAGGVVHSGASYRLTQNLYKLPYDCRAVERILDSVYGLPLEQFTPGEIDESAGSRTKIGNPRSFAEREDTPEYPQRFSLKQIELFPAPQFARGLPLEYLRSAYGFDGQNPGMSPLPFVSQSVLLYGVRADIALAAGKLPQASAYEAKFQEELKRLLFVEHTQRRAKPTIRMAARFTRHRLQRVARDYSRGWDIAE